MSVMDGGGVTGNGSDAGAHVLRVGWKVASVAGNIASVRYRAVLPMLSLQPAGVVSTLFAGGSESLLDGLHVLVIVKSFTADDLRLAQVAARRGIRVVFDLCDNIFIEDYGRKSHLSPVRVFLSIAPHAHCIVATTEPLAAAIRERVGNVPVIVIPDGIESPGVPARISRIIKQAAAAAQPQPASSVLRQRVINAARLVRREGVQVIPSLVGFVARRVGRIVARGARGARRGLVRGRQASAAARPLRLTTGDAKAGAKRIVWFGNHGAEHGRFGMLDILEWRAALETLAIERDVELVVISNNARKYDAEIAPLAIPSQYVEWSSKAVEHWLQQAAVVIIPNTLDPFSVCKSANRTVLALAHGVPVVATMTPALRALGLYIETDDPLHALRRILDNQEEARARARRGYEEAESLFGLKSLQVQWLRLLHGLEATESEAPALQPYLLVVLHLIQDVDLALPILREASAAGIVCEAWCSAPLFKKSPRVLSILQSASIPFKVLPDAQRLDSYVFPERTRVLLTIAETNLGPHRIPRSLSEAAVRQGLLVATLQHGFENVGLSYEDSLHAIDSVDIAAQRIYIWGPMHTLHARVAAGVRARCMPVGCPKDAHVPPAELGALLPLDKPLVGVFENLHWHRYSDAYRKAFIGNVLAAARARPDLRFLVKPHHAGVWLTRKYDGDAPEADNLIIADPQAPEWELHTASALLGHMSAVITTPSTVALDAARCGLPVAVVAEGLILDAYRPLTTLSGPAQWLAFVDDALAPDRSAALRDRSARFVHLVLVPGNAAGRIIEDLRTTAGA